MFILHNFSHGKIEYSVCHLTLSKALNRTLNTQGLLLEITKVASYENAVLLEMLTGL